MNDAVIWSEQRQPGITAIVCGSRRGYEGVGAALSAFERDHQRIAHLIVGSTQGVDRAAHVWALEQERIATVCSARWRAHGKLAGPVRNQTMAIVFSPDMVLAFPGGAGTECMVDIARREGIALWRWEGEGWKR